MEIQIDARLHDICERHSNAEYLLTWILGYVHQNKARELFQICLSCPFPDGPKERISLPDDLVRDFSELASSTPVEAAVAVLLIMAVFMGAGE